MSFFTSIWDSITGFDSANADRAAAADAAIQSQNAIEYAPGGKYYTPANAAAVKAQRNAELASGGYGQDAQRSQVNAAFAEGLDQGISNVRNSISEALSKLFKLLPWYVWALIAVALFIQLGGPVLVRRFAKK